MKLSLAIFFDKTEIILFTASATMFDRTKQKKPKYNKTYIIFIIFNMLVELILLNHLHSTVGPTLWDHIGSSYF